MNERALPPSDRRGEPFHALRRRALAALVAAMLSASAGAASAADRFVVFGPPEPYEGSDGIRVHLDPQGYDSRPHLDLAIGSDREPTFKTLCAAPCDVTLDPRGRYRVSGGVIQTSDRYGNLSDDAVAPSALFSLPDAGRNQTLHVRGRIAGTRSLGWVFLPLGAAGASLGIAAAAGALGPKGSSETTFRLAVGIPFITMGAAFIATGVYFFARPLTTVTDQRGQRIASETIPLGRGLSLGPKGLVF